MPSTVARHHLNKIQEENKMKRILSAILAFALVLSLLPMSVFAADGATFYADPSVSTVSQGESLSYDISLAGTYDGYAFTVNKQQSGFTVTSASGGTYVDDMGSAWMISVMGGLNQQDSAKTSIASVSITIDANATPGTKQLSFSNISISSESGDRVSFTESIGSFNVVGEINGTVSLSGMTAPVKGETPVSANAISSSDHVTATALSWSPSVNGKFAADTVYTATISVKANSGYVFGDNVSFTVDGESWSASRQSSTSYNLSKTFSTTAGKDTPVCNAPTNVTAKYGQTLSEITLANPGGNTPGTWEWTAPNTAVGSVGTKTFTATFTPSDTAAYTAVENISVSVTVEPKPITVSIDAIPDRQYTGGKIEPSVTVRGDGKILTSGTDYTVEYGSNKNVGANSGSVTVKAKSGSNYTFTAETAYFNIVAQAGTLTISGNLNITFGESVPDVSIDTHGSDGAVTVYYYTNASCTAGKTDSKPTAAGNYWARAEMAAGTNYGAATSNVLAFTIARLSISPSVSITGWTYKESSNEPTVTGNTDNGAVTFHYKAAGASDSTYTTSVPSNAGNYTVRATIAQTANYSGAAATADFTISPRDISHASIDSVATQPYTGAPISPKPSVRDGATLVPGTDFTYNYENNTNAGTAAVVKINGCGNYTGSASQTFEISRANLSLTVSITGWIVGGTPNTPSVSGNLGNGAVTYAYKEKGAADSTYSSTVPTAVGEYTVRATVAQTANYNAASATIDFVISTKSVQTITANDITVSYGETGKKVSASTNGNGTLSYAVKSGAEFVDINSSTGALTIKAVGTATITITASETSTHAGASKDITVKVLANGIAIPAKDTTVYTYNGKEQTYKVAANNAYTVTGNKQTAANESGYTVTIALKDKTTSTWSDGSTDDLIYTFIIKKATITITAPSKLAYVGDKTPVLKQSDCTITGLANGESLKTQPTVAYAETPDMETAGTVRILVSNAAAPDGGNYNDIVYIFGTLTIASAPQSDSDYYYGITVKQSAGGYVSASADYAQPGTTITITATPDKDYKLSAIKLNGTALSDVVGSKRIYTFPMPADNVVVTAVFVKAEAVNTYSDVKPDAYYYDAVCWALSSNILENTTGKFGPDIGCTRAEMVEFIWRAAGSPSVSGTNDFTDVDPNASYAQAVQWALENGITTGTTATTFSPDKTVTRAQAMTFLWRYAGKPVQESATFSDVETDAYYVDAVKWAVSESITNGTSETTFSPDINCSNAHIITFLYRWFGK